MAERGEERPHAPELVWPTLAEQPFFGVYLLQDGHFLYVNQRFADILGYSVEEIMALPSVIETVYEADRPMVTEKIRARLEGEVEEIRYALRGRRKDGSPVDLEVQGRRIIHDGRPAILGIQFDISERVREERTYHERKRAEALGALSAGVAHDFRNILLTISLTCDLVAPSVRNREAQDDLSEMRAAVERGKVLCEQLMEFGAGARRTEQSASVNEVLQAAAPIFERLLGLQSVRLAMKLSTGLPRVRATSAEIEQVLMNLLLNARDATPDAGEVVVSTRLDRLGDVACVRVDVQDRGVGIAPDHLRRLFEPYFTTKGDQGTGLGLRNVKRIVTSVGGEVRVDSKLGEGTIFTLVLPEERRRRPRARNETRSEGAAGQAVV